MKYRKVEAGWLVRLEKDEELVASLKAFCQEQDVNSGWVQGLGGASKARIGYYNLNRKKYIFRSVRDVRELASLMGNISRIGDEVALHLHGVVSDMNNKPRGGHIQELVVGGTCEIYIQEFSEGLSRQIDPEIGLPLLDI